MTEPEQQLEDARREVAAVLESRRIAYARLFNSASRHDIDTVLHDLARFCYVESTFDPDPRVHALKEGRREVYHRIIAHAGLDPDVLFKLYMTRKVDQ